jgi:hypothetical protein
LKAVKEPLVPLKKNSIRIMDYSTQVIVEYINREKTRNTLMPPINPKIIVLLRSCSGKNIYQRRRSYEKSHGKE